MDMDKTIKQKHAADISKAESLLYAVQDDIAGDDTYLPLQIHLDKLLSEIENLEDDFQIEDDEE